MPAISDVPLISRLVPGGVKSGTMFLLEFDPDSQWLSVASTLAARFLFEDRHVAYFAMSRAPAEVENAIEAQGVDVRRAKEGGFLAIEDWYSASLTGGKLESADSGGHLFERIDGGLRVRSLRVSDLSVGWLKTAKDGPRPATDIVEFWPQGSLAVTESCSVILRFNEEKPFVEFFESRIIPQEHKRRNLISFQGVARGIHSDWFYKRMENASDGVVDLRLMERRDEITNFLRIRSLKGQPHDSAWHEIEVKANGEAILTS